jgi:predicted site-specific integrase-resolvase
MRKLVSIGQASRVLGVTPLTLRRWHEQGKLEPDLVTEGGRRRYDLSRLRPGLFRAEETAERRTVAYARVSSRDQEADLHRQARVLEAYCAAQGWTFEVVTDLGSGMNYRKRGLKRLLDDIIEGDVGRLVITHKDRLLRLGAELVFAICEAKGVEVVILNAGEEASFEEELAHDVLEIITVFSARLYGARSRKNAKMIAAITAAAEAAQAEEGRAG